MLMLTKTTYSIPQMLNGARLGLIFFLNSSGVYFRISSLYVICPNTIGRKTTSAIVLNVSQIFTSTYLPTISKRYHGVKMEPKVRPNTVSLMAEETFPFCKAVQDMVIP